MRAASEMVDMSSNCWSKVSPMYSSSSNCVLTMLFLPEGLRPRVAIATSGKKLDSAIPSAGLLRATGGCRHRKQGGCGSCQVPHQNERDDREDAEAESDAENGYLGHAAACSAGCEPARESSSKASGRSRRRYMRRDEGIPFLRHCDTAPVVTPSISATFDVPPRRSIGLVSSMSIS